MKRFVLLISIPAFFLVLSTMTFAQVAESQPTATTIDRNPIVNLEMTNVGVEEAINTVFANTNVNYILRPGITGTISKLRLLGIRLDQAIQSIADAAKLEFKINEEGTYVIGPTEKTAIVVGTQQTTQQEQLQTDNSWQFQQDTIQTPEFNTESMMQNPFGFYDPSMYEMQFPYSGQVFSGTIPFDYVEPRISSRLQQRTQPPRTYYRPGRFDRFGGSIQISPRSRIVDPFVQPFTAW
ncbi:MAG: hypothetical protein SNJ70_03735 [Armatimonadota bacterium]